MKQKTFWVFCIACFFLASLAWGISTYRRQVDMDRTVTENRNEDPYNTFADPPSLTEANGQYTDKTFGFSLLLPDLPEGTFIIKKETYNDIFYSIPITYIRFTVDASETTWPEDRYGVFEIIVYPRAWWDAHVMVDEYGELLFDGLSRGTPFETFAGKNEQHAFTLRASIVCAIDSESWQCDVEENARETVLPTLQVN